MKRSWPCHLLLRVLVLLSSLVTCHLSLVTDVFACQWCKDLMSWGLAKGFAWTIGILLIVPILIVTTLTFLIVRAAKSGKSSPTNC